jgi:hypothetical protein
MDHVFDDGFGRLIYEAEMEITWFGDRYLGSAKR